MFRKAILLAVVACIACNSVPPAKLEIGTEVPLILLTELSSGGSAKGTETAFMVTDDVLSPDSRVLIPKGAIAYGKVEWSRAAGAISQFLNEPARLAVSIDRTVSVDGQTISLKAARDGESYHFTRENTIASVAGDKLNKLLEDENAKKSLQQLLDGLSGSDMGDPNSIADLADALGLKSTSELARTNSINDLKDVLKGISAGEVARIATGQSTLVIEAIAELAGLRKAVGDRISGLFKGRNIKAFPGTPITAYVAKVALIEAPQAK